jgi:hypothetical protein
VKKPRIPPSLTWCLNDPHLFGPSFAHGDWTAWRAFIAALFAESAPDEATLALYRAHTGRSAWPKAPFNEAALIIGRRGGKSRILATIAVYLACVRNYAPYLAPGEVATIAVIAADRDQGAGDLSLRLWALEGGSALAQDGRNRHPAADSLDQPGGDRDRHRIFPDHERLYLRRDPVRRGRLLALR